MLPALKYHFRWRSWSGSTVYRGRRTGPRIQRFILLRLPVRAHGWCCRSGEFVYNDARTKRAKRTIGPRAEDVAYCSLRAVRSGGSGIFADVAQVRASVAPASVRCLAGCIVTPLVVGIREIERPPRFSRSLGPCPRLPHLRHLRLLHMPAAEEARLPEASQLAGVLHATSVVNLFQLPPTFCRSYAQPTAPTSQLPGGDRQQLLCMRRPVGTVAIALAVYSLVGLLGFYAFHGRPSGNICRLRNSRP